MVAAEAVEPRVALVLVSHSAGLAEGAAELARAMAADVTIIPAGGMAPPEQALGTDAIKISMAIEKAWSESGVLVLMDLGSALLSTQMALELLPAEHRVRVHLSSAPLVEGAVAAAVTAQMGDPLERVAADALAGLRGKQAQLGETAPGEAACPQPVAGDGVWQEVVVVVDLPLGLHARPAARLIQATSRLDAEVQAGNASTDAGPVSARSLNALATLQVGAGQQLLVRARGAQAGLVLRAVQELAQRRFDEPAESPSPTSGARLAAPADIVPGSAPDGALTGLGASPGSAFGPVIHLGRRELEIPQCPPRSPARELEALEQALATTRQELQALRETTAERAGAYQAEIIGAHLLFLEDPELVGAARDEVEAGQAGAARAWADATAQARRGWERMSDPRMRLRAADLDGVSRKVLAHLLGVAESAPTGKGVLVADELTPTDTAGLDPSLVLGIATAGGGPTSHSAILARSLGIPAVVGMGEALLRLASGTMVLIDGDVGTLLPDPPAAAVKAAQARHLRLRRAAIQQARAAHRPAVTRDGVTIEVAANIGSVADARAAAEAGADGVGLLRTEFLFQGAEAMPDEDAQVAIYEAIASALQGRPLTIRTLDVGADKPLAYLPRPREANPALGVRGLRLGLALPELLAAQLRAILRVASTHRLRVMFPMVASAEEITAARAVLSELEIPRRDSQIPPLEVGIMVEVPAAALQASTLAGMVDFMSLGTNDLSQYTLAADRVNPEVAGLADALHPAVLRLIEATAEAGRAAGSWVGVCGELAGEVMATELLIGLGVTELSAAPVRVAALKAAVRQVDSAAARRLAQQALRLPNGAAVRQLLAERADEKGKAGTS
ncbi:MAG: phosphoenolpyruvate--protein phosphotransferase [Candidatus Dormibacteria bacterium]